MSGASTTVVIVTYNSRSTIARALEWLEPGWRSGEARCVVVDNASSDGTPDLVAERFPWVELAPSGGNLGFGRGCNIGWKRADTRYALFLNPDAALHVEDIKVLSRFLDGHERAALVGPAIIEGDGALQHAGGLPTPRRIVAAALGRPGARRGIRDIAPGEPPFQTDWVCGAALMARRSALVELNGFDPRFFLYFEETDLCKRAAAKGYEIWAVGQAVARHVSGASAKETSRPLHRECLAEHYFPSRCYYLTKHFGLAAAISTEVAERAALALRASWSAARGSDARDLWARFRAPFLRLPAKVN